MVKGRLLAACSCLALCTLAQGAEEAPAAINWLRSMSEGAAAQRGTDKLLVVYLGGEHCPWCRKMEAETHADAKVISAMAKAVAVKPSGTDARALSSKYSIRGVPATLVLGPDGDLLTKVMGYRPPAAFLQALENAGTVYAEYVSAKTAAAANPGDVEAVLKFADAQLGRSQIAGAAEGYAAARKLDTGRKHAAHIGLAEGGILLEQGKLAEAEKMLAGVAKDHPDSKEAPQALLLLGVRLAETGKMAEAEKVLSGLAARYPKSLAAGQALYYVGVIQARSGRMEDALKSFRKVVDEHRDGPWAAQAARVVKALEARGAPAGP